MSHDVFISYRRDGGEYTAKILRDRLSEAGYRVFFDVESLRSGDFNTGLYSVIDECTDFLLVLSPGALDRCVNDDDWVRREIEYALEKGKNIVPVMLRGFSFPSQLPPSIEPLRYRNGLEANSQFFDAFLSKLTGTFLHTRPTLGRRLTQSTLLRRMLPFLLALLIVIGAGLGISAAVKHFGSAYPRTAAEKNLAEEVIYYAECNLTAADMIAGAVTDFLDAGQNYLSSSGDFARLTGEYELRRAAVEQVDLSLCEASEGFLNRLTDSPFVFSDVNALSPTTATMKTKWLRDLDYLITVLDPNHPFSTEEKLEVLACYRAILSHELDYMAAGCNHMLLPITDEKTLENFFHVYLPDLTMLPLSADRWTRDKAALESRMERCLNLVEDALMDLATRVGETNRENADLADTGKDTYEALVSHYMEKGYTREQAVAIVEKDLAERKALNELKIRYLISSGLNRDEALTRLASPDDDTHALTDALIQSLLNLGYTRDDVVKMACADVENSLYLMGQLAALRPVLLPKAEDDSDTIWLKMTHLLSYAFFDDARACVDAYGAITADSAAVTAALLSFIDLIEQNGLLYGVMVTAYYEPDGINEVLRPGDIILYLNDAPCGSYTTYMNLKSALAGEYTATVLRPKEDGRWTLMDLTLSTDMPRVYLGTVVNDGTDE